MASPRQRILSPFPTTSKNIILTGKGVSSKVVNGEKFLRVPYEDSHVQGVTAGYIDVWDESPDLDLCGVYQKADNADVTTTGGNTLVHIVKVEWARNAGV